MNSNLGLLDVFSGIIENNDNISKIHLDFQTHTRGTNFNTICRKHFLRSVDYETLSKQEIMDFIKNKFDLYRSSLSLDTKGIVLQDENSKILVGYNNKFCSNYADKVARRMRFLTINNANNNCVMLTLTIDPKKYNSFVDMWLDIKYQQHRFLTRVKQILKSKGIMNIRYLSSIECHHKPKSWMNPHIHIVFFDLKRIMDWRKLRDIWKLGHIWINHTKDGSHISKPINYIAKYITKTYTDTSSNNVLDQAIQWFFNIRSFSYSKKLVYPINYSISSLDWLCNVYCDDAPAFDWFRVNLNDFFSNYNYYNLGVR